MNFKFFISLIVLFAAACQNLHSVKEDLGLEKPNIVLINVDDWGYMDSQLYGSQDIYTPNVSQLLSRGMLFTQGYAAAANCAPSRACMLSGQFPTRHGIYTVASSERGRSDQRRLIPVENNTILPDSNFTLMEALSTNGYTSAIIGKYHLGTNPLTQGFDINIGGNHKGHPKSYFSPYQNPNLPDGPSGEYLTDRLTSEAITLLDQLSPPFFLYLPYYAVHTPLQGKKELVDKYLALGFNKKNAHYAAMVENMDHNIGRLLSALESSPKLENTLIILTSDNGGIAEVHSQSPLRAGKGSYYEGGVRVPLLFSWPGKIPENTISDQTVSQLDLYPTIVNLAKLTLPNNKILDGQDISPILLGQSMTLDRGLFWHFPIYLEAYAGREDEARDTLFRTRPGTTMRWGDWKLHRYYEYDEYELYNLKSDPGERNNLIDLEKEVGQKLKNKMQAWLTTYDAPLPKELNPDYVTH
ncbi:sulfatase [Membranihabitans marinus]|uniref:sulfatase n=1 Tax=Membranihabitans marinus TaxID=1227546 RepID=UPI001F210F0A|nr:sulfatase [Membranihabitans marinus]